MQKLVAATVFNALLITATGYGQEFKFYEVFSEDGTHAVKNGDWIHEDSEILVEYPKDWVVDVTITENGYLKKSGNLDTFITEPKVVVAAEGLEIPETRRVPIKLKPGPGFGLDAKDGQDIEFIAKKKNETGIYVYQRSAKFKIYKPGLKISRANSFSLEPLLIYETGKKVKPEGGKTNDINAYFGFSVLAFIKSARAKWLSDIGLGINVSYANTELIEEGETSSEGKNVVNAGGVIAYKINQAPLLYVMFVGGWGGLTVPGSEFGYFGAGLAYPIPL